MVNIKTKKKILFSLSSENKQKAWSVTKLISKGLNFIEIELVVVVADNFL